MKDRLDIINEILKPGIFVKFTKEFKHTEDLKHGIYMLPLAWFIKNGSIAQKDVNEQKNLYPIWSAVDIDRSEIKHGIKTGINNIDFTISFEEKCKQNLIQMMQDKEYKFASIIFQPNKYISQIINVIEENNDRLSFCGHKVIGFIPIEFGQVQYRSFSENDTFKELFKQDNRYEYQQEFRFIIDLVAKHENAELRTSNFGDINYKLIKTISTQEFLEVIDSGVIITDIIKIYKEHNQ